MKAKRWWGGTEWRCSWCFSYSCRRSWRQSRKYQQFWWFNSNTRWNRSSCDKRRWWRWCRWIVSPVQPLTGKCRVPEALLGACSARWRHTTSRYRDDRKSVNDVGIRASSDVTTRGRFRRDSRRRVGDVLRQGGTSGRQRRRQRGSRLRSGASLRRVNLVAYQLRVFEAAVGRVFASGERQLGHGGGSEDWPGGSVHRWSSLCAVVDCSHETAPAVQASDIGIFDNGNEK